MSRQYKQCLRNLKKFEASLRHFDGLLRLIFISGLIKSQIRSALNRLAIEVNKIAPSQLPEFQGFRTVQKLEYRRVHHSIFIKLSNLQFRVGNLPFIQGSQDICNNLNLAEDLSISSDDLDSALDSLNQDNAFPSSETREVSPPTTSTYTTTSAGTSTGGL